MTLRLLRSRCRLRPAPTSAGTHVRFPGGSPPVPAFLAPRPGPSGFLDARVRSRRAPSYLSQPVTGRTCESAAAQREHPRSNYAPGRRPGKIGPSGRRAHLRCHEAMSMATCCRCSLRRPPKAALVPGYGCDRRTRCRKTDVTFSFLSAPWASKPLEARRNKTPFRKTVSRVSVNWSGTPAVSPLSTGAAAEADPAARLAL